MASESEPFNDKVWDQHLKWLDLVSNECKANKLKRERENRSDKSRIQNSEDVARPPG
ncbi:hypothetical protein [Marinobacter confluentis]|uniref:hypothetical protein n=1 Tax=Marinobacter confluentis TaxID=1697557 RepID=UPI00143D52E8|nr:hypothetical protein [Marinobacter confluentis]